MARTKAGQMVKAEQKGMSESKRRALEAIRRMPKTHRTFNARGEDVRVTVPPAQEKLLTCQVCGDAGDVRGDSGVKIVAVRRLKLRRVCERCGREAVAANPMTDADKRRMRRNRNRREHDEAMRSLGLVKTPYGWE